MPPKMSTYPAKEVGFNITCPQPGGFHSSEIPLAHCDIPPQKTWEKFNKTKGEAPQELTNAAQEGIIYRHDPLVRGRGLGRAGLGGLRGSPARRRPRAGKIPPPPYGCFRSVHPRGDGHRSRSLLLDILVTPTGGTWCTGPRSAALILLRCRLIPPLI